MAENQGITGSNCCRNVGTINHSKTASQDGLIAQLLATVEILKQKITNLEKSNSTRSSGPSTPPVTANQTLAALTATVNLVNLTTAQSVGATSSNAFITRELL